MSQGVLFVNNIRGKLFYGDEEVTIRKAAYPVSCSSIWYISESNGIIPGGSYKIDYDYINVSKCTTYKHGRSICTSFESPDIARYRHKILIFDAILILNQNGLKVKPNEEIKVKGIEDDGDDLYFGTREMENAIGKYGWI